MNTIMPQEIPRISLDESDRQTMYPYEMPNKERDDRRYEMKFFIYYNILMDKRRTKPDKSIVTFHPV